MGYYNSLYIAVKTEISQRLHRCEELRILLKLIHGLSGTVVEVGCNVGYLTGKIASAKNVTLAIGIDTNKSWVVSMLARLRNLGRGIRFLYGVSGTETHIDNNSVDSIVLSHVLEHFEEPAEILSELRRVLKNDGRLIVAVPKEKYLGEFTPDHKLLFGSSADLKRVLESNGFGTIEEHEIARSIIVAAVIQKHPNQGGVL